MADSQDPALDEEKADEQDPEEAEDQEEVKRQRKLTEKGEELFRTQRQKLYEPVDATRAKLEDIISNTTRVESSNVGDAEFLLGTIRTVYREHTLAAEAFTNFLKRTGTEESAHDLANFGLTSEKLENSYKIAVNKLREIVGVSESSRTSAKRAQVEAARVRLAFARKEAEMRRQRAIYEEEQELAHAVKEEQQRMEERKAKAKAERMKREYDLDLKLLQEEREVAAVQAEAACMDGEEDDRPFVDVPYQDPHTKTREYVTGMDTRFIKKESVPIVTYRHKPIATDTKVHTPIINSTVKDAPMYNDAEVLTTFLLRKDIMPQRLQKFNDKPQCFGMWRKTFKTVMTELRASPEEEMDLLMKNLGDQSKTWAENIRASNTTDAERGLQLIWERLEEFFGSPERIEESIKNRVEKFPQITNRDNKKLYDLYDLLVEIESVKRDDRFASQFAIYDSSAGANLIVGKLPYGMQQKWISRAAKYKKDHSVTFPPFAVLVDFVKDMSTTYNDPAFKIGSSVNSGEQFNQRSSKPNYARTVNFKTERAHVVNRKTAVKDSKVGNTVAPRETCERNVKRCPIHHASHSLVDCNSFKQKTIEARHAFLREKSICFKCLESNEHISKNCPSTIECEKCGKRNHRTIMLRENAPVAQDNVTSKCTSVCGEGFKGRSCGKIVLVNVSNSAHPSKKELVYAILDDQSNRSLIASGLCDKLNVSGSLSEYMLHSCSGSVVMAGRRASGLSVSSVDGSATFELPTLLECDAIPQDRSEIPTPEVAMNFAHLKQVAPHIPPLEKDCKIQLLIGRDLPVVHHVVDQRIGPKDLPFASKLPLGWVIIGEVCLGRYHRPDNVHTYFTHIGKECRGSIFRPCPSMLTVKEPEMIGEDVFRKTPEDDKVGMSAEDREFIKIMNHDFKKDESGLWTAPLPFKTPRTPLAGNRDQVFKRAIGQKKTLEKNPSKCQHMVQFMEKILSSGAAEKAPDVKEDSEKWYLPLFGVYHPRKPDQIRGVFDSSITYKGNSLNDSLLSGPNLTNSLLGVLLRFRRDKYAVSADVEQMFYRFLVNSDHRKFLRFFWHENNSPERPLVEYQMRVHVFGNRPSPAVATYGLRKAAEKAEPEVEQFVRRDFYVDDALTSKPSRDAAISLLKRTREALHDNGKIHLHKIASNDLEIMNHFPRKELDTSLKDLDLQEELPTQKTLGLTWDIGLDMFVFAAPSVDRPFTRRGLLAAVNSIFDPCGFVAPFSLAGKILLRRASSTSSTWDDPLPSSFVPDWVKWKSILEQLHGYTVPRMYLTDSLSLSKDPQVLIFSDASETAIAAVAYVTPSIQEDAQVSFIMGKAKVAPKSGHTIPRLELCAAVLATEVGTFVADQLDIPPTSFRFYTDSKVVLGYICNKTRRFYTYVSNRVAQIHAFSQPEQWSYIQTELNPADAATRLSLDGIQETLKKWHTGLHPIKTTENSNKPLKSFPLLCPEGDIEVRPDVVAKATHIKSRPVSIMSACERFSQWTMLVVAFSTLIHIARTYSCQRETDCSGWHICKQSSSVLLRQDAERFILSEFQKQEFPEEIRALQAKKAIPKSSRIISLSPYLDECGMLRVGGRLRNLKKSQIETLHPLIVPRGHVATLLIRHCHELTSHQGRHLTEGAIRSKGYWIIGGKRSVSSVLHNCVTCRKLRGPLLQQKMADLPEDRLTSSPPFTFVGVDVFGPWTVSTRRTRGGSANSKRWAVVFTCLYCRAVHIELLEEMSTSSFINAMRRFIAIRGKVTEFKSDRGTNFVGAVSELGINAIYVEDDQIRTYLTDNKISWRFNPPHASHFGGVWERMIGVARRILDAMLLNFKNGTLTHEVLSTFMSEVVAIINSRPLVPVSSDAEMPFVLSPGVLLTQKAPEIVTNSRDMSVKDMYRSQWKLIQILADTFWKRWKNEFLSMLQSRRKWVSPSENVKIDDVVLLREKECARNDWPVGLVTRVFPDDDKLVRKLEVRVMKDGKAVTYTRPICELVLLLSD